MKPLPPPAAILLASLVLAAAIYDLRCRRIPNWLTIGGIALGFALNLWLGEGRAALAGFGLAVAVYLPMFLLHAMGGGDLKLMAGVGAIAGATAWFGIFILTAILGGVAAVALLLARGGLGRALRNILHILKQVFRLRAPYREREELDVNSPRAVTLPHGAVIAAGTLFYLLLTLTS
jgi:prepilin peptidase CpaA